MRFQLVQPIRYFGTRKANVIPELEDKRRNISYLYISWIYTYNISFLLLPSHKMRLVLLIPKKWCTMIEHVTKGKSIRQKFYWTIRNEFVALTNNILKQKMSSHFYNRSFFMIILYYRSVIKQLNFTSLEHSWHLFSFSMRRKCNCMA